MQEGIVVGISKETSDVNGFTIKISKPFSFIPGQFVMLAFSDSQDLKRAFSIVHYDKNKNEFFLLIKKVGEFTTRLFQSKEGTKLLVFGPYGRFCLPKEQNNLILIAGGVGITPLYSMLYHIQNNDYPANASLYYSTKKKNDMILLDRILDLDKPQIKKNLFFTKEDISGFNSGRICIDSIKKQEEDFEKSMFYICGPKPMIESLKHDLEINHVSPERIMTEEFD